MRILRVNDVANVGATLVKALLRLGHDAELRRLRLTAKQPSILAKLAGRSRGSDVPRSLQ